MAHQRDDAGTGAGGSDGGNQMTGATNSAEPAEPSVSSPVGAKRGQEEFLTVDEAAVFLKTSRSTLYRHIDEGKVGGWFLLGDELRFSRTLLIRWAEDEAVRSRRRRRRRRSRKDDPE